jgi:hypothetical protein
MPNAVLEKALDVFDADGDGKLSPKDIRGEFFVLF